MDPWTTLIYGVCVDTTVEVCNREFLNISCGGAGRVILINAALYGRMRVGRCVQRSLGYVDCQADVLDHIAAIDPELLDPVYRGLIGRACAPSGIASRRPTACRLADDAAN